MDEKLRVLDLFSGLGGFSLGLERTGGFETVAFCEIEPFPRKILAHHWPEVPCYEDVTTLTGDILRRDGIGVDVITGGFPCQDISVAGRQAGINSGTRSGLWSEIVRLTVELRPRYVIVENVAVLLGGPTERPGGWFGSILGDLAEIGYDAEWEVIPASSRAVGAPHRRERVWIVAYPASEGLQGAKRVQPEGIGERPTITSQGANHVSHTNSERPYREGQHVNGGGQPTDGQERELGQVREVLAGPGDAGVRGSEDVANASGTGLQGRSQAGDAGSIGAGGDKQPQRRGDNQGPAREPQPRMGLLANELPRGMDRPFPAEPPIPRVATGVTDRVGRLKALGNAVVPAIPELIGRAILEASA